MTRSDRQLLRKVSIAGLTVTVAVILIWAFGWLRQVEGGLYDIRAQQFQYFTRKPTDRLVHVDIDDTTLDMIGAWPWPRTVMADLIDEMALAQAKVIALDILYTQEQKPEWQPLQPTAQPATKPVEGPFKLIDHDENLAAAFRRAQNVLMAASLQFRPSRPQTPTMTRAVDLLRESPAMKPAELETKLVEGGASKTDVAEAIEIFYALRREAVQDRVEADMVAAGSAEALSANRPPGARDPEGDEDPVILDQLDRLFPGQELHKASPEYRLVAEAYEKAKGLAAIDRFSRPLAPGVTAFKPRGELPPVPTLIEAASYSGFVDYPPLSDGTVRSVPLFVEHHGKLFPQMGMRIACALLDIDPAAIQIEQDVVTLPATKGPDGTSRPPVRVPLRVASQTFQSGRRVDFPLLMDIPWFGPRQWETMYDPSQPNLKKQHVPLAIVYAAVRSRQNLERSLSGADLAARDLIAMLAEFMPEKAAALRGYDARRITGRDFSADTATIDWLLGQAGELDIKPDSVVDDSMGRNEKTAIWAAKALADARSQLPALHTQLSESRKLVFDNLAGKAALIGWTSTWQVADTYPTPLHDSAPGVVVHGVLVNALMTGDVWSTAPAWINALIAMTLGVLTTFAVARLSPGKALAVAMLIAVAYVLVNGLLLFDYGNILVELGVPLLAIAGAWAAGTITRLVFEARERARITKRFSAWVDPDIVNYFLEVRDETLLSGQRRDTTVVFTDLAGFTTLSEQLGEDVVPLLNDFMGRAVHVIKQHRGVVNKFLGDGILFFFNAPRPNQTYVTDAVESILHLDRMMVEFNADLAKQKLPQVKLRAGLTTGQVIAGDAGTAERADYTVIGDLVNLAARLESANKFFGTSNLVTDATVEKSEGKFLFRPIGAITVVGQQTLVRVFETLGYVDQATEEQKKLTELTTKLYDGFAAGDAKACLAAAAALEAHTGPTKLTKVYRTMCEPYATGEAEGPMPKQMSLSEK